MHTKSVQAGSPPQQPQQQQGPKSSSGLFNPTSVFAQSHRPSSDVLRSTQHHYPPVGSPRQARIRGAHGTRSRALAHTSANTHTHTHLRTHTHTRTRTRTHTHTHTHAHIHTRVHTHIHTRVHTHTHTRTHKYNDWCCFQQVVCDWGGERGKMG